MKVRHRNKYLMHEFNQQKEHKNGVMSPDSPEQEADYTLTPRTEAKYNKIDEDFQMMMQRNQQQRVAISGANYTLPVTVPITANYGDSGMLQASPQMAHTNISPRPSSSETDSGNFIQSYFFFVIDVTQAIYTYHAQTYTLIDITNRAAQMSSNTNKFISQIGEFVNLICVNIFDTHLV